MEALQHTRDVVPLDRDWRRCIHPDPTRHLKQLSSRGYAPEVVVSSWLPEPRVSVVYRARDGRVASACNENCAYPPTEEQLSALFWQATDGLSRVLGAPLSE